MTKKPTYEELEQRVKALEGETIERLRVEKSLRESEERFRETIDLLPSIVCEYDTKGSLNN